MKKYKIDWQMILTGIVFLVVIVAMTNIIVGCGIDMSNVNNQASGDATIKTNDPSVEPKSCAVSWEYTTSANSSITILKITGAESGMYNGTCSSGSITSGTFVEGDNIDPCPSDLANKSTFETDCGWLEIVAFDS